MAEPKLVGRAGEKLEFALKTFNVEVKDKVCADFGSNVGGFVSVLLEKGASKVYAVETGYGVLDWNLRRDPRVIAMERTNAMNVSLPEKVDFISVDVSWTPQLKVLPNVVKNLKTDGNIISLIKPHYEATSRGLKLSHGQLSPEKAAAIAQQVAIQIEATGFRVIKQIKSPLVGGKAGNIEYLFWLRV